MTSIQDKLLRAKVLIDEALEEMGETTESKSLKVPTAKKAAKGTTVDFSTNERAFFKQHAGKLAGPKKFVLMLAYLAKGGETTHTWEEITRLWSKVEGVMGGACAGVYGTRAKEQDWVDSPESGSYVLRPNWKQIFD